MLPELPGFPGHFRKEVSMQTLSAVIPVLLVIALGMVLRRRHWVSRTGIDDIKFLVSRILLPVAIFNALSTAEYSMRTWITVAVILVIEVATFGAGFLVNYPQLKLRASVVFPPHLSCLQRCLIHRWL